MMVATDNLLYTDVCPEPYYDFHSTPRQRSYPSINYHGPGKIGETAGCSGGQPDRYVFIQKYSLLSLTDKFCYYNLIRW
jgi:hypothetical protein